VTQATAFLPSRVRVKCVLCLEQGLTVEFNKKLIRLLIKFNGQPLGLRYVDICFVSRAKAHDVCRHFSGLISSSQNELTKFYVQQKFM
jgi:hypothetical protein